MAPAFLVAASAAARSVPVDLRVVATSGKSLADQRQYTDTVTIDTDRRATCFGPGSGGSGDRARIAGPTALGAVIDASRSDRDLRPISITDSFSFGLGICGFGRQRASGESSWYLKVNHANPNRGGDQVRLKPGDEVLWYLAPSFPYPNELVLRAPARARAGVPFAVRVLSYDDEGERSPVAGARVGGAQRPTGGDGRTMVTLDRTRTLRAAHGDGIPSNLARVCVVDEGSPCPARPGKRILGSARADRIGGTKGPDAVKARAGADRVAVRGGGADRVDCGPGRDVAIVDRSDRVRRCERVRRR